MTAVLVDVVSAKPLGAMKLRVEFEDGAVGKVDLARWLPNRGVFRLVFDPVYFRKVRVNRETGTIAWPNEADGDPLVLYHWTTGKPLPEWAGPLDDGCPSCTNRIESSRGSRATTARKHGRMSTRSGSAKSR